MPVERAVPTHSQIVVEVKQIVSEFAEVSADQIHENSDLVRDLGCDSLDIVEIAMEVEEHFDITIPDDLEQQSRTVGQIADGVLRLLEQEIARP